MTRITKRLEKTAYHEAGHAVVAYCLRRRFAEVSIIPADDTRGHVGRPGNAIEGLDPYMDAESARTRNRIEAEIMVYFAGGVAEWIFSGRHGKGTGRDDDAVITFAEHVVSSHDELEAYISWLWIKTRNLLSEDYCWAAVQALAKALLEQKEIGHRQARKIISTAFEEAIHGN